MLNLLLKNEEGVQVSVLAKHLQEFCACLSEHLQSSNHSCSPEALLDSCERMLGCAVSAIILYGSYARGCASASSDVDFLILCNRPWQGSLQGLDNGVLYDGYIHHVSEFLTTSLDEWLHLKDARILAVDSDNAELHHQISARLKDIQGAQQENAKPKPIGPEDRMWLEKMLHRVKLELPANPAKSLMLIVHLLSEYRQIYAQSHGWSGDSVSGWMRALEHDDPELTKLLAQLASRLNMPAIDELANILDYWPGPAD